MRVRARLQRLRAAAVCLVWGASAALLALTPAACTREAPEEPAGEATPEPTPDPYATCREFLTGTWTHGSSFEVQYDPASGAGLVNWRGNRTVVASVFVECAADRAVISAEGKLIELRFLAPDRLEASSDGYGSTTLERAPPPPSVPGGR